MIWSQSFVVIWMQFVLTSATLLLLTRIALRWIRQPVERIRLIQLTLAAVLALPILISLAPWTIWRLEVLTPQDRAAPLPLVTVATPLGEAVPMGAEPPSLEFDRASEPAPESSTEYRVRDLVDQASHPSVSKAYARRNLDSWTLAAIGIALAHAVALVFQLVEWCVGTARLRAIVRSSGSAPQSVLSMWNLVAGGSGDRVKLYVSSLVETPLTFGWLRPVVVIPRQLADLDGEALRFCLAHEWSHVRRTDILTWRGLWACQFLLWYQPLFWTLRRELRISQDILADGASAASDVDAIAYSELLVQFAKNRPTGMRLAGALTFFDHPSQLMRRVSMLLERPIQLRSCCTWRTSLALAIAAVSLAGLLSGIQLGAIRAEDQGNAAPAAESPPPNGAPAAGQTENPPIEKPAVAVPEYERPVHLTYACSVVDAATGKGIPNATVTVERQDSALNHKVLAKTQHVSDARGRFTIEIPPEQAAISTMYIQILAEHDDYVRIPGSGYSLHMLRKNETFGERPFFERLKLQPADRVTGKVLSPSGQPVAGAKIFGFTTTKPRDWDNLAWLETKSADDGSFRLNVVKQGPAFFWIHADEFAVAQQFIDQQRGDLGEIRLSEGQRITGRVLRAEGKPIAGIAVNAYYQGQDNEPLEPYAVASGIRRGALTDEQGRFSIPPMPPGEYRVVPEDELCDPHRDRKPIPMPGVFVAAKITLQTGVTAAPIEFQGVPHVILQAQYYGSDGRRKIRGHEFWVAGQMDQQYWSTRARPSPSGESILHLPHGLQDVRVSLITNEHSSLGYRRGPGQPIEKYVGDLKLGTLNDDLEGFEIIRFRAPIALVKAVDAEGRPIRHFQVLATYAMEHNQYGRGVSCSRQDAETYRTSQMLPDEEVTFTASATGYQSASTKHRFTEGESKEVVISLKSISPAVDAINSAVDGAVHLFDKLKPAAPRK